MNDDLEQQLGRLTPRGVRPDVRPRVLAAVANQLPTIQPIGDRNGMNSVDVRNGMNSVLPSRRLRRAAWAAAVAILLGIALNIFVCQAADRRMARLVGPPPPANPNAERALAEYNAMLRQLLAELQSPVMKPRPPVAPRRGADGKTNDSGFLLNDFSPPAAISC
jgi:hypothetical protein